MTSTDEQDAPPGPVAFDTPDADDDRPGREITDFVARYRDGFPPKIAASDGCLINTTYTLADGDAATDEGWQAREAQVQPYRDAIADLQGQARAVRSLPNYGTGSTYNGRGTEPHDGRAMTVRDDTPLFIEGPRDPLGIVELPGGQHFAYCAICPSADEGAATMLADGRAVVADGPGSARSAMASHLRRQHDRSPWPGQR